MMTQYEMRYKCQDFVCLRGLLGPRPRLRRLSFVSLASLRRLPLCF
jgi:hypothetical protein